MRSGTEYRSAVTAGTSTEYLLLPGRQHVLQFCSTCSLTATKHFRTHVTDTEMSSPLDVKRRRLNNGAKTLSKPFISPLKAPKTDRRRVSADGSIADSTYQPSVLAHTTRNGASHANCVGENAKLYANTPLRTNLARKSFGASIPRADPAELEVKKHISSLEKEIRAIQTEIDDLKQAARIETSSKDADLEALAVKWKLAAQAAAEELFGTVKERVCRMGGVAAWRETEKRKHDRSHGFGEFAEEPSANDDADCEFDSQGEELPEEEQEWRRAQKKKARQEAMDAADVDLDVQAEPEESKTQIWQESSSDDDVGSTSLDEDRAPLIYRQAFTIDMMLRSLNIDLDLIGYDKHAGRWMA